MGEMLTSRNRNETQNNSKAHFAKPKRNTKQVRCPPFSLLAKRNETTEMGEIDLEFRFFNPFFFGFQCHPT